MPHDVLSDMAVVAVRGPMTATLMGLNSDTPMGDPGLFAADLLDAVPPKEDTIGIVPHHGLAEDPRLHDLLAREPALRLIDVRTKDAVSIVEQIASCRAVFSSSLHGLIVADSLGIPNEWLDPAGNHECPELKFHDYAASVGRRLKRPLSLDDLPMRIGARAAHEIDYADGVAQSRAELRSSFESVKSLLSL